MGRLKEASVLAREGPSGLLKAVSIQGGRHITVARLPSPVVYLHSLAWTDLSLGSAQPRPPWFLTAQYAFPSRGRVSPNHALKALLGAPELKAKFKCFRHETPGKAPTADRMKVPGEPCPRWEAVIEENACSHPHPAPWHLLMGRTRAKRRDCHTAI